MNLAEALAPFAFVSDPETIPQQLRDRPAAFRRHVSACEGEIGALMATTEAAAGHRGGVPKAVYVAGAAGGKIIPEARFIAILSRIEAAGGELDRAVGLAVELGMTKNELFRASDTLTRKGLIAMTKTPHHRAPLMMLTPDGRKRLKR